jgi:hypothetical protein
VRRSSEMYKKVLFFYSSLYLKLVKQFVKACSLSPKLIEAKVKADVFTEPPKVD